MSETGELAGLRRRDLLKSTLDRLGLTQSGAFDAVIQLAGTKADADPQHPDAGYWKSFFSSDSDRLRQAVGRGGPAFRKLLPLLSEVLARNDPDEAHTAEGYERHLWFGMPLEATTEFRSPKDTGDEVRFPFYRVGLPDHDADADAFYDAVPQGPAAIAAGLDAPRTIANQLRARLFGERARDLDVVLLSGPAGAGKSIVLDRVGMEALQAGCSVFGCKASLSEAQSFLSNFHHALHGGGDHVVVLVDEAHLLPARGIDLGAICGFATATRQQRVTVVLALNWGLLPLDAQVSLPQWATRGMIAVGPLDANERPQLVTKLLDAEQRGLIRHPRNSLPAAARLEMISDPRDHLVLLALLRLRYGANIRDVLREEFNAVPPGAKEAYRSVVVLEKLGAPLASVALRPLLTGTSETSVALRHLTREDAGRRRVRHPLLLSPSLDVVIPDEHRANYLAALLVRLAKEGGPERQVVAEIFTQEGLPRRLLAFFRHSKESIREFLDLLRESQQDFVESGAISLLHTFRGVIEKDILGDYSEASYEFEDAVAADPENSFAARQLVWSFLRLRDMAAAEAKAREALARFPGHLKVELDAAFVLSWCSISAFHEAGDILERLLTSHPEDGEVQRRWERHLEGAKVIAAASGDEIPDWACEAMKAPRFIWQVRRHAKQYRHVLMGNLAGALACNEPDIELVQEALALEPAEKDKRLRGLISANLARLLYERWYVEREEVDLDQLEELFKESTDLCHDEPFSHCWYGTFLKEARNDYEGARREYDLARSAAGVSRSPFIVEHPMILNNLALLHMDAVLRQRESASSGLPKALKLVDHAIERIEPTGGRFTWPLQTRAVLMQMFEEHGLQS